jgi:hypothetical protein
MKLRFEIITCLLLLMVASRLGSTYFSPLGIIRAPEHNFSTATLGRDLQEYTIKAWRDVRSGKLPYTFGYGSVLAAGIPIQLFEYMGVYHPEILFYQSTIVLSVIGFFILLWISIRNRMTRLFAMLFYATFLLGVPMNKAIESGNPDLFIAPIIGVVLLLLSKRGKMPFAILGILLGFLVNMKAFLMIFALAVFVSAGVNPTFWVWFIISFAANALWPRLYGIPAGLFDVFFFGMRGSNFYHQFVYTKINYGNNAILSYVSNVFQIIDRGKIPLMLHQALTIITSILLGVIIFVKPWFDEKYFINVTHIKRAISSFPFAILAFTISYVAIITIPAWSYDYRILYCLPILFCLLNENRDKHTTRLVYLSIFFLLIKSLFIPKDRFMNIFLYLHLYYMLRASVSLWIHRKNAARFV